MANDEQPTGGAGAGPPLAAEPPGPPGIGPDIGAPATQVLQVAYRGEGADLFLVMLKNIFLTLITLGIYTPWARAARRRYLWSQVDIDGQRLEFTGTGKELFIGYLKVIAGYLVLVLAPQLAHRASPALGTGLQLVASLVIIVLLPYAIYWSRRYLLGRTRWRGIRFGLAGSDKKFAGLWIKGFLLTAITLGIYGPVFANRVHAAILNDTRFGTAAFSYDGPDRRAFRIAIKGWVLSLLTLGIYYFWYRAELTRFRLAHTRFDRAAGSMELSGGLLFKLTLINLFGNLLSLGIAIPWTMTYTLRTLLERLRFAGPVDFAQIMQRVGTSGDGAGDTLAGALGVELGI